jgi:hypothetical protein
MGAAELAIAISVPPCLAGCICLRYKTFGRLRRRTLSSMQWFPDSIFEYPEYDSVKRKNSWKQARKVTGASIGSVLQ